MISSISSPMKTERDSLIEPRENDVLCWRGAKITGHPGNAKFYNTVQTYKHAYSNARFTRERQVIVENVVDDIKRLDPPGRFLSREGEGGPWYEISDERALEKASQALRLNATARRNNRGSRNDESGFDYLSIMDLVVDTFGCSTKLERVDENPQQVQQIEEGREDNHRKTTNKAPAIDGCTVPEVTHTFSYKPNEYGLPAGRDKRSVKLQRTFSYKPNEYGLPAGRKDPNLCVQRTFSYKPNKYGLPPGREVSEAPEPRESRESSEPRDSPELPSVGFKKTFSYKPNAYGLPTKPKVQLQKTFSYKPNMYGLRNPEEPEKLKSPQSESEYPDDDF